MKQLQIFGMDTLAMGTKKFSIAAIEPYLGSCHIQVSDTALGPTVDYGSGQTASMTKWNKAIVGLQLDIGRIGFGCNVLIDNFYSTKGEIRCYSGYGHRRPPLYRVYLGR